VSSLLVSGCHTQSERRRALVPLTGHLAIAVTESVTHDQCDRLQTYGYFRSRKTSPPFGHYQIILLSGRGTYVCACVYVCEDLPWVVTYSTSGRESSPQSFDGRTTS